MGIASSPRNRQMTRCLRQMDCIRLTCYRNKKIRRFAFSETKSRHAVKRGGSFFQLVDRFRDYSGRFAVPVHHRGFVPWRICSVEDVRSLSEFATPALSVVLCVPLFTFAAVRCSLTL